ncbi:MAG: hypothetical protein ACR2LV_11625 [Solirubrobacteraceae bacterium]
MAASFDDAYREMIVVMRDGVRALLDHSDHGSWFELRIGYRALCRALERDDQVRERDNQVQHERKAHYERNDVWKRTPAERRESLLLHVLGDERLIIRQLTSRLNAELGSGDAVVYESHVRGLVMRMLAAGQLERVEESFRNKPRYRYFRKRTLEGPIAGLERAFVNDDDEKGGE